VVSALDWNEWSAGAEYVIGRRDTITGRQGGGNPAAFQGALLFLLDYRGCYPRLISASPPG
jgi:hypothetical protein